MGVEKWKSTKECFSAGPFRLDTRRSPNRRRVPTQRRNPIITRQPPLPHICTALTKPLGGVQIQLQQAPLSVWRLAAGLPTKPDHTSHKRRHSPSHICSSAQLPPNPWAGCRYNKHPSQSGVLQQAFLPFPPDAQWCCSALLRRIGLDRHVGVLILGLIAAERVEPQIFSSDPTIHLPPTAQAPHQLSFPRAFAHAVSTSTSASKNHRPPATGAFTRAPRQSDSDSPLVSCCHLVSCCKWSCRTSLPRRCPAAHSRVLAAEPGPLAPARGTVCCREH